MWEGVLNVCRLGFWTVGCAVRVQSRHRVVGPIGSRRHASPGRDPGARWIPAGSRRLQSGVLAACPIVGSHSLPGMCLRPPESRLYATHAGDPLPVVFPMAQSRLKTPSNAFERSGAGRGFQPVSVTRREPLTPDRTGTPLTPPDQPARSRAVGCGEA